MKPRGRFWKAVKRIGVIATVMLMVTWVASGRYIIQLDVYPPAWVFFFEGKLFFQWDSTSSSVPWEFPLIERWPGNITYSWWFSYGNRQNWWTLGVPMWFIGLLIVVPTALMFRSDRRRRRIEAQTLCAKCGYSKIGLPANHTCPECGQAN